MGFHIGVGNGDERRELRQIPACRWGASNTGEISCPNVAGDDAFESLNMIQKPAYILGLDLNIDLASRVFEPRRRSSIIRGFAGIFPATRRPRPMRPAIGGSTRASPNDRSASGDTRAAPVSGDQTPVASA